MTFLPDVNVWIALAVVEHVQHRKAISWYESLSGPVLAFCRITQMSFLRLLTNSHVMHGDALTPNEAWRHLDEIHRGIDTMFAAEPDLLDETWRALMGEAKAGANLWTDSYLAAFARDTGLTLVTFDRGFSRFPKIPLQILDREPEHGPR